MGNTIYCIGLYPTTSHSIWLHRTSNINSNQQQLEVVIVKVCCCKGPPSQKNSIDEDKSGFGWRETLVEVRCSQMQSDVANHNTASKPYRQHGKINNNKTQQNNNLIDMWALRWWLTVDSFAAQRYSMRTLTDTWVRSPVEIFVLSHCSGQRRSIGQRHTYSVINMIINHDCVL